MNYLVDRVKAIRHEIYWDIKNTVVKYNDRDPGIEPQIIFGTTMRYGALCEFDWPGDEYRPKRHFICQCIAYYDGELIFCDEDFYLSFDDIDLMTLAKVHDSLVSYISEHYKTTI